MIMRKCLAAACAAAVALTLSPGAGPAGASPPGRAASPAAPSTSFAERMHALYDDIEREYRPEVRWWLAEGLNTDETLRKNIQEIADSGFGAAEFLAMPEAGAPDETYGWGSEEWTADSRLIIEEATRLGLGFSLTSGTHWSHANLPDTYEYDGAPYDPDSRAASKSLDYRTVNLAAGETFSGELPQPGDEKPAESHEIVLQGVVAAKVTQAREGAGVDGAEGTGTGTIDAATLTDLTAQAVATGDGGYTLDWTAPQDGSYALFTFWMYGTAQTGEPSVSTNYTVNYLDSYGIDALKDYWADNVLTDDFREVLEANGRGEIYMDSLELENPGAASSLWGYDFKREFLERRGYDLTPYLPLITADGGMYVFETSMTWDYTVAGAADQATIKKVRADVDRTRTDLYEENVLKPLQEWVHGFGMKLRAEPSYGTTFEISTPAKYLDDVETETYAQNADVDLYRGMLGSANMYDLPFSSETGAVFGRNYHYNADYWTRIAYLQFAMGVNRTVFHGYSAIEGSEADTAWPGHEGMYTFFSERFNSRQPTAAGYPEWTEMLGRNQKILQQGQPQRDIAILRTDNRFNNYPSGFMSLPEDNQSMHDKPYYWKDTSLQQAGYTYDYFSPQLLEDTENVTWNDQVLQPDGPSYQAVIVFQESMELESAERLLEVAKDGLPVVFVNNTDETLNTKLPEVHHGQAASTSTSLHDTDADLAAVVDQIKALPHVRVVDDQADTLATLQGLGVDPRVGYDTPNNKILTISRLDEENDVLYTFAYSYKFDVDKADGPYSFDLDLDATGTPYTIEDWTGDVDAVGTYTQAGGRTTVPVTLKPGESTVIALDLQDPAGATHAVSTTADRVVSAESGLAAVATSDAEVSTVLSDGRTVTSTTTVPEKIDLPTWDIAVEDWNEGEKQVNTETKFGHETREAFYTTEKTTLEFPDSPLVAWKDLPATPDQLASLKNTTAMDQVSGIGTYTTSFELPQDWDEKNGANLTFTSVGGGDTRVVVNGSDPIAVDTRTLRADVSDVVRPGVNTVEVTVATTLTNRMMQRGYATPGPAQSYGLQGAVAVEPYVLVDQELDVATTVTSRCVSGRAGLTVTTTNGESTPVAVGYASDHGTRTTPSLAPAAVASHDLPAATTGLAAGQVTVTVTATAEGRQVVSREVLPYAARDCSAAATTVTAEVKRDRIRFYERNRVVVRVAGTGTTPTGGVQVTLGGVAVGAGTLVDGRAVVALDRTRLRPGRHDLRVAYSGDESHAASSTTVALRVDKALASVRSTVVGGPVRTSKRARVRVAVESAAPVKGWVRASEGSRTLTSGVRLVKGSAVVTLPRLARGTHRIVVRYGGSATVQGASVAVTVRVR
jgi:hypothetical protein